MRGGVTLVDIGVQISLGAAEDRSILTGETLFDEGGGETLIIALGPVGIEAELRGGVDAGIWGSATRPYGEDEMDSGSGREGGVGRREGGSGRLGSSCESRESRMYADRAFSYASNMSLGVSWGTSLGGGMYLENRCVAGLQHQLRRRMRGVSLP